MSFQICLCGAAPGFPHAPDCPRPLFHARPGSPEEARWNRERLDMATLASAEMARLLERAARAVRDVFVDWAGVNVQVLALRLMREDWDAIVGESPWLARRTS